MRRLAWFPWGWIGALCLAQAVGCAKLPYQYGRFPATNSATVQIEQGKAHPKLDRVERALGLPRRLIMRKDEPRDVPQETTAAVATYLERNQLNDVRVSVRDYQPRQQWQRLRENQAIAPAWRYTLGSLTIVRYTLLPGRVFGHNDYNPFTNTLYVNSNEPALLLHEAAYAKDVHGRMLPGTYAAISGMPGLSLGRKVRGASDVLAYAQTHENWETEREAYRKIYPKIGSESLGAVASPFLPVWWADPLVGLAGSAVGRGVGQVALTRRERELQSTKRNSETSEEKIYEAQPASYQEPEPFAE